MYDDRQCSRHAPRTQRIRHTPCAAGQCSKHALRAVALSLLAVILTACGGYEPAPSPPAQKPAAPTQSPAAATTQPQKPPAEVPKAVVAAPPAVAPTVQQSLPPTTAAQAAPNTVQTKADVGAGKQGHYGGVGMLVTPVSVYFRTRENITFRIQIPEAMKYFKVNEGRPPKSHDEFMQRIIKENNINLPPLPDEERYIYDVKTEQLMVEQPRR